ncbi:MAG: formate dehydrogenase accessory sulfurtransferase FdhD, partial [Hyphomicrobiales bacterium]|nr:formate dehydrogenase accessory sulfurtransferase FdhD [Hyphomicrobiales bacterium]
IITVMTVGEHPRWLALGYLRNQSMLQDDDVITGVDVDDDLGVIVVRTERATDYEEKLQRRTRTSGCAMGTMFGDVMESFDAVRLDAEARIRVSWLGQLTRTINTTPSLYLKAGAIHGCVLCHQDEPLIYVEDVGRHNAVDTIAGYMWENAVVPSDKIFYTTGRLTSEMILKTVRMEIPILVSRSGFTAWGVELARRAGLTLIGRARGERFLALSGHERIVFDDGD